MNVSVLDGALGAVVDGVDLGDPAILDQRDEIERLLGERGVLCFRNQSFTAAALRRFSAAFGTLELNVVQGFGDPTMPEVMILSNIVRDGKPIGLHDAGQGWHTDMSYSRVIAFANVLHAIEVPSRDGAPLGDTEFSGMQAAYAALSPAWQARLAGLTVTHDFNKFWEMMRQKKGSSRPPLTPEQRAARPPVSHPIALRHPLTGRPTLYANPGYSMRVNEVDAAESDEILAFLFAHQTRPQFRYRHRWQKGDVLMWDNIGTIHNAIADYRPDEHRLMRRCQVAADRFPEHAA